MRKWKCISGHGKDDFIVGNIYESNDEGYGLIGEDGFVYDGLRYYEFTGAKFEEVFEKDEEKKVNKFKVGDIIVGNNSHRYGYTNKGVKCKIIRILRDEKIEVRIIDNSYKGDALFVVEPEYFDLVTPLNSKSLTITTSDSITTLTDGIITVSVNRYYTDKHNERNAVSIVIDKYYGELARIEREKNMPKVGDKVKVSNFGKLYPNYRDWLIENNVPIRTALKWEDDNKRFTQTEYKVVAIHPHREGSKRILALIEGKYESFIIGIEGLKVIK